MTSEPDLVVICDDAEDRRRAWHEAATHYVDDADVVSLDRGMFVDTMKVLDARRREARRTPLHGAFSEDCILDRASILFVDYDLIEFDESVTGEMVAYLARCYSTCGAIIGLNQFGEGPFDLTLIGHPDSFADLNLGGRQLLNPGLWGDDFVGFRPWSWPVLKSMSERFVRRSAELEGLLGERVLDYFGFGSFSAQIPRASKEFLGVTQRAEDVTFERFVTTSGNGLHPKDSPSSLSALARIASARLARWLERLVLAGQEVLVDAPHLVPRVPELLQGDRDVAPTWDATATLDATKLSAALEISALKTFEFTRPSWLSRPAWYWFPLRDSAQVQAFGRDLGFSSEFVFCEDMSRFLPRDAAREFVSDVASPHVRRFAIDLESGEADRFLEKERRRSGWDDEATDPTEMDYRPAVRFAL